MKNHLLLAAWLLVAGTPLAGAGVIADSGQVLDRYIGADDSPRGSSYFNGSDDAIGDSRFDVHWSSAVVTDTSATFTINTNFVDSPTALGTRYGDLFFSFGGYTPDLTGDGSLPGNWFGLNDDAANGTTWSHAIRLTGDLTGNNGGVQLVEMDTANYLSSIETSDDYFGSTNNIYREGQLVRALDPASSGNLELGISGGGWIRDTSANTLAITVSHNDLVNLLNIPNQGELAWHWTMTCGNDAFQGVTSYQNPTPKPPPPAPVPEPHSLAVFGLGALGMVGYTVRRRRKS